MNEDDFQSMSKGVFVIPFDPQKTAQPGNAVAGPSRPRPLSELYRASVQHYEKAYRSYEADRLAEQLDDIADWLEEASKSPILQLEIPVHRLPVAILQDAATLSKGDLESLGADAVTISGSEAIDLTSVTRLIAIGLTGEEILTGKRTGKAGLDEVEQWYKRKTSKLPLLLYVQDAQMVPPSVLGELMYILTLHPSLPVRLLLSVPSTTHFLSSWTPLDLSTIALSILSTRNRKRNGGIEAILRASNNAPIKISEELAEEIRSEEKRAGGGALLAMKAIKWLLLRHSLDSPLVHLMQRSNSDNTTLRNVQALVDAVIENPDDPSIPGGELFILEPHRDLSSVINPAPRMSILHALSNAAEFIKTNEDKPDAAYEEIERSPSPSPTKPTKSAKRINRKSGESAPTDTPRSSKRRRTVVEAHEEAEKAEEEVAGLHDDDGSRAREQALKQLQVLFEFWKSAGRSVNLWDWLEGFSGSMLDSKNDGSADKGMAERAEGEHADHSGKKSRELANQSTPDNAQTDGTNGKQGQTQERQPQHDEENEARLHAVFIRFVEEARMIGLIRARGKGRRADEVVKGVGLI
ncbi:hypothetical protein I316_05389 [Kwoniella heveanensis BCC8398]|uniref:Origin recognition complex subunit 3 winged helix C-terminal domain-containing protein n=1 Tax=Kwoniella heveanensis BCC8398 TaxID=1296120 RepID=A0A1B9GPW9_9TREE|nr:hypothetical protein I316_05389 [Kwoniella heveanensis BCC8398]